MNDFLTVKVDSKISGVLSFEENEYIFSYKTEDKKDFISLTMPVRTKSWNSKNLHPLFEMHLPEGYLLSIIKIIIYRLIKAKKKKKIYKLIL